MAKITLREISDARMRPNILRSILTIAVVILVFAYQFRMGWFYLGGKNGFGDFGYVLERIPCIKGNWDNLYGPRTEEVCSGYIYGSSLLVLLDAIGMSLSTLVPISYGLAASLVFIYLWTILKDKSSIAQNVLAVALLFSPPVILLIERMNVDVIVFLCVYAATKMPNRVAKWIAPLLIALSTLFKFYTLPLILIMLKEARGKLRIYLFTVLVSTLVIISIDLSRIEGLPWDARNMFGNAIWGEYLLYLVKGPQTHANFIASSMLGIAILIFVSYLVQKLDIDVELKKVAPKSDQKLFIFCFILYLTCYFSGLSVDYRLIFLLFAYVLFEAMFTLNWTGLMIVRLSILATFYMSYNVEKLQPLGDLTQLVALLILAKGLSSLIGLTARNIFDKSLIIARIILSGIARN